MIERKRRAVDSLIAALRLELESEEEEMNASIAEAELRERSLVSDRVAMSRSRGTDDNGIPILAGGQS